jgi:ABC-type enterochelin transport system substrate-binding protein
VRSAGRIVAILDGKLSNFATGSRLPLIFDSCPMHE